MLHRLRSWSTLVLAALGLLVTAGVLASCGGGSSNSNSSSGGNAAATTARATATPAPVATITIADNSFTPAKLTVKAGTTVRWVWTGNNAHSVLVAGLNSGEHTGSGTFEQTFPSAGATVQYQCGVHGAAMAGVIVVE